MDDEGTMKKREATPLLAFTPKSIASQRQIDKFKELSQKLLQVKGNAEQKSKFKGAFAIKRKCVDLDSAINRESSNPDTCTVTKLELSEKLLQNKEKIEQNSKSKGNSIAIKRKCLDLDSPTNKEASNQNTCTEIKLDERTSSRPKYKKKLHWGLETKEKWERKSNM